MKESLSIPTIPNTMGQQNRQKIKMIECEIIDFSNFHSIPFHFMTIQSIFLNLYRFSILSCGKDFTITRIEVPSNPIISRGKIISGFFGSTHQRFNVSKIITFDDNKAW
jgi:hypothetical protein